MTCREIADFLMHYLDGELDPAQRAVFEHHLSLCPDCVHYLRTYEQGVAMGRMICKCPESNPPPEVPEELIRAILAARAGQS
jgi:anti-sigma factor RsiW